MFDSLDPQRMACSFSSSFTITINTKFTFDQRFDPLSGMLFGQFHGSERLVLCAIRYTQSSTRCLD